MLLATLPHIWIIEKKAITGVAHTKYHVPGGADLSSGSCTVSKSVKVKVATTLLPRGALGDKGESRRESRRRCSRLAAT